MESATKGAFQLHKSLFNFHFNEKANQQAPFDDEKCLSCAWKGFLTVLERKRDFSSLRELNLQFSLWTLCMMCRQSLCWRLILCCILPSLLFHYECSRELFHCLMKCFAAMKIPSLMADSFHFLCWFFPHCPLSASSLSAESSSISINTQSRHSFSIVLPSPERAQWNAKRTLSSWMVMALCWLLCVIVLCVQ